MSLRRVAVAGFLALLWGWMAQPARADVRRVQTIGAVPLFVGVAPERPPRDAAILQAQLESVKRVAEEMLQATGSGDWTDSDQGGSGADGPSLEQVLGRDMGRYTNGFRILEDRGEQPPVFSNAPDARAEYVVVVEVQVDADRVRGRLEEAGLLARAGQQPAGHALFVEVRGLDVYPAYDALRELIVAGAGARSAVPVSFARDWVVLRVESDDAPDDFMAKLVGSAPPDLEILPIQASGDRLRLSVKWTAPAPESSPAVPPPVGASNRR